MLEVVIGVFVGVVVTAGLFILLKDRLFKSKDDEMMQLMEMKMKSVMPELTKSLIDMANDKLGSEKKEIKTDMEAKRSEIERMVKKIEQELRQNQEKLEQSEKERFGSYKALTNSLDEYKKITDQLAVSTDNLRKVLSNNQLRGQFGEQVAEDLLKMSGFVRGTHYEFNKEQKESETRPDFSVFLPDGTRINVDAKFPYANLQKMAEAEGKEQKDEYLKQFERDVKEKVRQVTTRDYINPEAQTVDFVILFIPNEMIFSFIYDKLNEVWNEAMQKKVILAGPFSFTALLRMVMQAYDNFRYQSNIRDIIKHVQTFEKEFDKFYGEFQKIGDRIQSLEKQYNSVNTTRANQLIKSMDKVRLEDGKGETDELKLLDVVEPPSPE